MIVTKELMVQTLEDFTVHMNHWKLRVNQYTHPNIV